MAMAEIAAILLNITAIRLKFPLVNDTKSAKLMTFPSASAGLCVWC